MKKYILSLIITLSLVGLVFGFILNEKKDIKVGGLGTAQYRSTALALTNGDMTSLSIDVNGNLKSSQSSLYLNGSTSQLVKTGVGRFCGLIVNSHTSGTVKFWDNTSAATTVLLNTITLAAGPQSWVLPTCIQFNTGLYLTVGGTIDYTVLYQ